MTKKLPSEEFVTFGLEIEIDRPDTHRARLSEAACPRLYALVKTVEFASNGIYRPHPNEKLTFDLDEIENLAATLTADEIKAIADWPGRDAEEALLRNRPELQPLLRFLNFFFDWERVWSFELTEMEAAPS